MKPILFIANMDAWRDNRVLDLLEDRPTDVRSAEAGDAIPEDAAPFAGVVIGGGLVPVRDAAAHAPMRAELALIESALAEDVPFLGICLGAQLLAHTLGAPVTQGEAEAGYCPLEPLSLELSGLERVFQWHWEGFGLPAGAERLARSACYDTQAIRYGRAYGFQFHPDVRPKDIPDWLSRFPEARGRPDVAEQQALAKEHDPKIEAWFARFLRELFAG